MFLPSDTESDSEEEIEIEQSRFQNVEISTVIQNCRVFNDVPLDVEKSIQAMMDLLYLLHSDKGELSQEEATDIFFMSTKLMQSSNLLLRRLHYILVKELAPKVEASYIASNSLIMDMKNINPSIRGNALRTLFAVMDVSMYHTIDRMIVENFNSMHKEVTRAAYLTAIHLAVLNGEMVRKWASHFSAYSKKSESPRSLMDYYWVALLYITNKCTALPAKNFLSQFPYVTRDVDMLSARICAHQLQQITKKDCGNVSKEGSFFLEYIKKFLTSSTWPEVTVESCMALSSLRGLPDEGIEVCVNFLHKKIFTSLLRENPDELYMYVTALARIARAYPGSLSKYSWERLLSFSKLKYIGVKTIVTLFHVGNENAIKTLLGDLSTSVAMKEMSSDVKYIIIESTLPLQKKFPSLVDQITDFLFSALSEVDNLLMKQRVVDTVILISKLEPRIKDTILTKLADSIDDCDFPAMTKRVLSHLSEEIPLCTNPRPYIRYIYNHCKLEEANIRAAAVRTLAKIAAKLLSLRSLIVPLIMRCCNDEDDDVRDRAIFYTKLFCLKDEKLIKQYITDIGEQVSNHRQSAYGRGLMGISSRGISDPRAIQDTTKTGIVGSMEDGQATSDTISVGSRESIPVTGSGAKMSPILLKGREELHKLSPLRQLGAPLRSIEPILLTDPDSDYAVSVIKHLTPMNIILQFRIHNTMDSGSFVNVTIMCDTKDLEVEPKFAIPISRILPGAVQYAYVVLEYEEDAFPSGEVSSHMRFTVREAGDEDDEMGSSEDLEECPLETFDVEISDFLSPLALDGTFEEKWEAAKAEEETAGTYELQSLRDQKTAEEEIAAFFGLHVMKVSQSLYMSGIAVNSLSSLVLIKAKVFISTKDAVVLQIAIRGGDEKLREFLTNALLA